MMRVLRTDADVDTRRVSPVPAGLSRFGMRPAPPRRGSLAVMLSPPTHHRTGSSVSCSRNSQQSIIGPVFSYHVSRTPELPRSTQCASASCAGLTPTPSATMNQMNKCFLAGHGACGGKISREHYISKTILNHLGQNGSIRIGGLPWQQKNKFQLLGINSLASKILCETHNAGLGRLDGAAGAFFRALDAVDKRPTSLPPITIVDGATIEKWFLKIICGLAAGIGFSNGIVPFEWKRILTGMRWPQGWGMYVPAPMGIHYLVPELFIETLVNPDTNKIMAAKFRVAGVHFSILLGRPDDPSAWGTHRPRGLIFRDGRYEKKTEFKWPFVTERAVIYTCVGPPEARAPQWDEWK